MSPPGQGSVGLGYSSLARGAHLTETDRRRRVRAYIPAV